MKKRLMIATGVVCVLFGGIGGYAWMTTQNKQVQNYFAGVENGTQKEEITQGNESGQVKTSGQQENPKQTEAPAQEAPKQVESSTDKTQGSSTSTPGTSKVELKQGEFITVAKGATVDLYEYIDIQNMTSGSRGFAIQFSNPDAIEVVSETPNGTPVIIKVKSDVQVSIVTETNNARIDFKVK